MGAPDAIVLGLLAVADMALLGYLRRRRSKAHRLRRMWKSLDLAIRRDNNSAPQNRRSMFGVNLNLAAR